MIAKLKGVIDTVGLKDFILDVNGVGYEIFASSQTLRKIGGAGSEVTILIETHVREDHIHLYGFADALEKEWFQTLCRVQGVGTKVALAILSVASPKQLQLSIASGDKAVVKQADGVGPKLATRIVTELKDKVANMNFSLNDSVGISVNTNTDAGTTAPVDASDNDMIILQDAISALVNLGYPQGDVYNIVHKISSEAKANDEDVDLSKLIRDSLKKLSSV